MKKILITSLILLLIIISTFTNSFAFSIGNQEIFSIAKIENLLTFLGDPVGIYYAVYQKDGVNYPAYCIERDAKGVREDRYTVDGSSKIQNVGVWRAIINGYPYKSLEELGAQNELEAYLATRSAVHTMLYNFNESDYAPVDSEEGRRTYQIYLNIVKKAKESTEEIINDLETSISQVSENWEESTLKGYVSKTYTINSNVSLGKYKIELNGNAVPEGALVTDVNNNKKESFNIGENFKIMLPIQKLEKDSDFEIIAKSNLETKPVAYGKSNSRQDYALTGYKYEEKDANLQENYSKNLTKLVIIKKEYGTEKRLQGVKFNLLDENKKIYMENLITNENGEIILENMIPGKYYLQEIETLENYSLYEDFIEINLNLNEELQTIVNNSIKRVEEKKLPVTGY